MCNRVAIIIENYPLLIGRSNAHKISKIIEIEYDEISTEKINESHYEKKKKRTREGPNLPLK